MDEQQAIERAETVAYFIWLDLSDRRGLSGEWDGIEPAIKAEILSRWVMLAQDAMTGRVTPNTDDAAWELFQEERTGVWSY